MSPKMAQEADESDEEEANGEDGEQDAEGEDGEEGAALSRGIRSERCAGQSPTASQSPQSLRYSM